MGILDFYKLPIVSGAERLIDISDLKDQTIAIDTSLLVHAVIRAVRANGSDLINSKGQITSHLQGILYRIIYLLEQQITPIFVFDGEAPKLKEDTLKKRSEERAKIKEKLDTLDKNSEEYGRTLARAYSPKPEEYDNLKIMLDLIGIKHIQAVHETDVVCAWMSINGYVDGVGSDDSDILAYGALRLYKNLFKRGKISSYKLEDILEDISYQQFTALCTILGNDNCPRIKGIGVPTAMNLIRSQVTLKNVIEAWEEKKKIVVENVECYRETVRHFRTAGKDLDTETIKEIEETNYTIGKMQKNNLYDWLLQQGFDSKRMKNIVNRIETLQNKMKVIPNKINVHHSPVDHSEDFSEKVDYNDLMDL